MYAYLCKGMNEMKAGNYEKALELLTFGQILPQSLGAGIWNHCKYIPMRYRAALCLEALGRKSEADEIYTYIATTEIEYFSNMHLPELPYYQALSYDRLGESFKARSLITKYRRAWSTFEDVVDNGFFATTPFFMPFIEEPKKLRRAKALYFNGLVDRYLGLDAEADKKMAESFRLNNDNLFAKIM
jgi:tetratricopeptide (TPR) repeat protein